MITRDDPAYEPARRSVLWNRRETGRHPEVIVRAATDDDVVRALAFARAHGLRVAVRSGGHSWCGAPLRDGSLLVDLGARDAVLVDAASRAATIEPAVTNQRLAAALADHALAFPYGHCPSVALGGYVLAGGFGWNARAWGMACDHLRALDVVLPDGRRITATDDSDAELLWAARGAGPGFCAVVTRFHLDLRPQPRAITASRCVYPLADALVVAAWCEAVARALPAEVELTMYLACAPDGAGHACTVAATAFGESPAGAARALAFMTGCPAFPRALERVLLEPTTFPGLFAAVGAMFPSEHRYAADNAWTDAALADVVDRLCSRLAVAPSRQTFFLCALAPAPGSALRDAAFAPGGSLLVNTHVIWDDAADDAANLAWHADTMAALALLTGGHYVGEADLAAGAGRAERCFTAQAWQRLAAVRERYDPEHLLHGWFA